MDVDADAWVDTRCVYTLKGETSSGNWNTWASAGALELDLVVQWFRLEASISGSDDDALKQIEPYEFAL